MVLTCRPTVFKQNSSREKTPEHPSDSSRQSEFTPPDEDHGATGPSSLRRAEWTAQGLAQRLPLDLEEVAAVSDRFRLRVPHHYLGLIGEAGDPIWRQAVPSAAELGEAEMDQDPLAEDDPKYAPVPHLTHRYPDRVLLLVTDLCPMFCRFCMRKRKTLAGADITPDTVARGIAYVRRTPQVREVILSGGDPLMLTDRRLSAIIREIRTIGHVEAIRIHTRMPCVEPGRVTESLAESLTAHGPLTVCVHFNHPREVTPAAERALGTLRRAGIPLHNQAVLLAGVNADPAVLADLFRRLMRMGVHPYYLHHPDLVPGTAHFRLSVQDGQAIVAALREMAPDLAMLHYVLDTPGGGGKVPLG